MSNNNYFKFQNEETILSYVKNVRYRSFTNVVSEKPIVFRDASLVVHKPLSFHEQLYNITISKIVAFNIQLYYSAVYRF